MTGIIIQARMSSTRLPGKVMLPLAGHEVLWHVVERCKRSKEASRIIVATSIDPSDEVIFNYCHKNSLDVFRGDLSDVLKRYYDCATAFKLDTIVRVTSDCPLIDPWIIDESITLFHTQDVDYLSNCLDRTFPRGLDCEVFSYTILKEAHLKAQAQQEREHVTPWMLAHGRTHPYPMPPAYHGDFRLTLDEQNDYKLLRTVYEKFYHEGSIIDVAEVIKFLQEHPEIAQINQDITQKHSIN